MLDSHLRHELTVVGGHAHACPFNASELAMRVVLCVDHWYTNQSGPTMADAARRLQADLGMSRPHAYRLLRTAMHVLRIDYDKNALHTNPWGDADAASDADMIESLLAVTATPESHGASLLRNAIARGDQAIWQ